MPKGPPTPGAPPPSLDRAALLEVSQRIRAQSTRKGDNALAEQLERAAASLPPPARLRPAASSRGDEVGWPLSVRESAAFTMTGALLALLITEGARHFWRPREPARRGRRRR